MSYVPVTTSVAVRGESSRWVDPDFATLGATVELVRDNRAQALADASAALDAVVSGVTALGAVPAGVDTRRAPLTYAVQSFATTDENAPDPHTGAWGLTGRIGATVSLQFTIRDLTRLDAVIAEANRHATVKTHGVGWEVDDDNPAWRECRIDAVQVALDRARDYATALGGTLVRVEQLADAGLSGATPRFFARSAMHEGVAAISADAGSSSPSLTPVPQQVSAAVEARVAAEVPSLA